MSVRIPRDGADSAVEAVADALRAYQTDHPAAEIEVYRQNEVSVRVRVTDPDFQPVGLSDRSRMVWPLLRRLPEEVLSEVSMVILVSPAEKETSLASREFDDPLPSRF